MQRRIGWLDALPQLWLDPRRFALAISVVALMVGIILGVTNSLTVMVFSVAALILLDLAVFKQDEALATVIIIISVLLDWYELLWPNFYFPAMTTVAACCFIGLRFLTQSPERPWVAIPQLRWRVALLILAAFPILRAVSLLEGIRYYLDVFGNAMLLAVVGMLVVRNLASLRRLLSMLSALGTLVALHSIIYVRLNVFILANQNLENYLSANQYFHVSGTQINRAGSFLLNPDFNGSFLAMMFFLPVGLFFASSSRLAKVCYALEVLILFAGLYYTYSLGSLLAVGVGALAFVLIVARSRYRLYTLGALGLAVVGMRVLFPAQAQVLLQRISSPSEFSLRLGLWETALRVIAAHPLTGIGLGLDTYLLRAEPYRVALQYRAYAQPHESYLEIAAMAGLPVLALFLFILGRSLWATFRAFRNARGPHRGLIAAAITAILVMCVNSLTINEWTLAPLAATGWLIVGAISSPALARELASIPLRRRVTPHQDQLPEEIRQPAEGVQV
jgi:hypothetical protein